MRKIARTLILLPASTLISTAALSVATPGVSIAAEPEPVVTVDEVIQPVNEVLAVTVVDLDEFSQTARDTVDDLNPYDNPTGEGCIRIAFGICYYPDPDDGLPGLPG